MLEERGIVGEADGAKPREILVSAEKPEYDDTVMDQVTRDKWQM
jgi:DNA segregation ATPase FtsK/SpoIIIE-like protein